MLRIYSFLFILTALSFGLTACETELGTSDGITMPNLPMKPPPQDPPVTYDAHPAFAFTGYHNGVHNLGVSVKDLDGTDEVIIYLPEDMPRAATKKDPGSRGRREWSPTWSPNGNSISFAEGQYNSYDGWYGVRALDVSVGTDGKPVASNIRTICGFDQGTHVYHQDWSPVAADNRIAFVAANSTEWGVFTQWSIYLVSASGGTPTRIYNTTSAAISSIAWSSDGQQIAFVENAAIKIINTSGTVVATLEPSRFVEISSLEWSNAGLDKIAFSARTSSSPNHVFDIYTIDATSGATAAMLVQAIPPGSLSNYYSQEIPFWAPDNNSIIYRSVWYSGSFSPSRDKGYRINLGSGTSTELGFSHIGDWKTPN